MGRGVGVFYPELRVKGLNCARSWGSLSQVRTPARQPIVRLSGKWRTRRTKATIAICSAKHKGVRRRQVVLKGRYSPAAAMMTTNYGEGRGEMGGEGERDVLKKKKKPLYKEQLGQEKLCLVCVRVFACVRVCVFVWVWGFQVNWCFLCLCVSVCFNLCVPECQASLRWPNLTVSVKMKRPPPPPPTLVDLPPLLYPDTNTVCVFVPVLFLTAATRRSAPTPLLPSCGTTCHPQRPQVQMCDKNISTGRWKRTHAPTHLMGEDFGMLPEALLQLQLLRHFCELLSDKLGNWAHTETKQMRNPGQKQRHTQSWPFFYGHLFLGKWTY